jgi:transcriptional regulator with XRE-family HTH domain
MRTEFGRFCVNLRIERDEFLKNMADKLNVTPSWLSAVEMGKKSVPSTWEEKISKLYDLNEVQVGDLRKAIKNSVQSVKIDLRDKHVSDRRLVIDFAKSFDGLTKQEKEVLKNLLL